MANGKKDPPKSLGKAVVKSFIDPLGISEKIDKVDPVGSIYEMGKKFYNPITNLFKKDEDAKSAIEGGVKKVAENNSNKRAQGVYNKFIDPNNTLIKKKN